MKKAGLIIRVLPLCLAMLLSLAAAGNTTSYVVSEGSASAFGNLSQEDALMTPTFGNNGCPPTALVNSFIYLQNTYPTIYGTQLVASSSTADMATTAKALTGVPSGTNYLNYDFGTHSTTLKDYFWGTSTYIEGKVPNQTGYLGQVISTGYTSDMPAWVNNGAAYPTWQFLFEQLQKSQAVIIFWKDVPGGTKKHFMSVTGMNFNDANNNGTVDFSENATITYIDPKDGQQYTSQIWQYTDGTLRLYYHNDNYNWYSGNTKIYMAESFGPVPLPGTLLLLGSGLLGLAGVRRRFKRN